MRSLFLSQKGRTVSAGGRRLHIGSCVPTVQEGDAYRRCETEVSRCTVADKTTYKLQGLSRTGHRQACRNIGGQRGRKVGRFADSEPWGRCHGHTLRIGLAPWAWLHTVTGFSLRRENHTPKRPPPLTTRTGTTKNHFFFCCDGRGGGGEGLREGRRRCDPVAPPPLPHRFTQAQNPDMQIRKRRKKRWIL